MSSSSRPNPAQISPRYRGRFAPSPTGPLHLGSLYTALASFLEARSRQGEWLLRIDDIDTPRVVPGAADGILRTLEYFRLHWDGPVIWQSTRLDAYRQALATLMDKGLTYPCLCTRKQLTHLVGETAVYPGYCRHAHHSPNEAHALRLRAEGQIIGVTDQLQGEYRQDFSREIGDFVLRRRDGIHTYHLATVVDDAQTGVTEVLRGLDLLDSTPRQILLQRLLGLPTPAYLHIPLVVDRAGIKLSKQMGATAVDHGHPSATLHQLLILLRQNPPNDLSTAPLEEVLAWAIAHWDVYKLQDFDAAEAGPSQPYAFAVSPRKKNGLHN